MSTEAIVLLGAVVGIVALIYNSLVSKKNEIENALGGVHSYLKKRSDLIPGLVATVKQYAQHETKLLTELAAARAASLPGRSAQDGELQSVDSRLSRSIGQVFAIAENYPQLRANENFLGLQASLNEIEGQLSAARRTYNAAVVRYNTAVESLPTAILASILGYRRKAVFQVTSAEAQNPDVAKLFGQTG